MTATAVSEVLAWEAFDSRGNPTVGCEIRLRGGARSSATVPSGASTGGHEARELRDGGERYGGLGTARAVSNVRTVLGPAIMGLDAGAQDLLDDLLVSLDGTPDLGRLGANAVLAVSLAARRVSAEAAGSPLYRVLDASGGPPLLPLPMVNLFSGGAHAADSLDVQDVLVVPVGASDFPQALEWVWRVRRSAAGLLAERGERSGLVADEGGLAVSAGSTAAALELACDAIDRAKLRPAADVALAVDVAANTLADDEPGVYRLRSEGRRVTTGQWLAEVAGWCRDYPVVSVEDVLCEDDWTGWTAASDRLLPGRQLVGDDLFATDVQRLTRGIQNGVANAVLVKPNQTGTVTRAERVVRAAQAAGYATIVSARSGDTEDDWLADLAVGWRAGQIKVGSTVRSERNAKWNRLMRIAAEHGPQVRYAGSAVLAAGRPARGTSSESNR